MAGEETAKDKDGSFIQKLREDPVKSALLIVAIFSLIMAIYSGTRSKKIEAETIEAMMTPAHIEEMEEILAFSNTTNMTVKAIPVINTTQRHL